MRLDAKHYLAGLAVVALVLPRRARADSVSTHFDDRIMIAGKQLEPGDYQFRATEGQKELSVKRDGTVVAQVPCPWVKPTDKSPESDFIANKNQIIEVNCNDKMKTGNVR